MKPAIVAVNCSRIASVIMRASLVPVIMTIAVEARSSWPTISVGELSPLLTTTSRRHCLAGGEFTGRQTAVEPTFCGTSG